MSAVAMMASSTMSFAQGEMTISDNPQALMVPPADEALADSSWKTGGTVGFNQYDMNNTLRMFFYPAVAGWIIIFAWIASLTYKLEKRKLK